VEPEEPAVPATHSVPDAAALGRVLTGGYRLPGVARVRFHRRGLSDVYLVDCGEQRFVARVFRSGARTDADVRWEAELLTHLRRSGVAVTGCVPTSAGKPFTTIRAPEGRRQLMLLTYAPGHLLR
jgi:Ser/Thr protein kinase RdoA (MazF antagonist)